MKSVKPFLIAALAAVVSTAALAQADPRVPASFKQLVPAETGDPLVGKVSQSRPSSTPGKNLITQVTYKFTISNKTTNDLNRVFFEGTFRNVGGIDPVSVDTTIPGLITGAGTPPYCQASVLTDGATFVRCELGSLQTQTPFPSADVYVIANVPSDGQQIRVDWRGGGFEGNGGGNGCCAQVGTYFTQMIDRTVDQSFTFNLQTFVKKEGTELFTGDVYITRSNDQTTTRVVVPKIADNYTGDVDKYSGQLVETSLNPSSTGSNDQQECKNLKHFSTCFMNTITIPKANFNPDASSNFGPDKLLSITLRVDSSAIRPSTKIEDVTLYYVDESNPDTRKPVSACVFNTDGTLPSSNLPCWTERFQWDKTRPGWTQDLNKDLQWGLRHSKNGTYRVF